MYTPVSYTHLDVYKRQEDDGVVFAEGNYSNGNQAGDWKYYYQGKLSKIINFEDTTGRYYYYTEYKPVSYTHLDVYKRQD